MKLWILVGAFGLFAAPNAFALDALTDPAETQDEAPIAHVQGNSAELKRKCAAGAKQEPPPRQQRENVAAAPPPQRPPASDRQHADRNADPPPPAQDERSRGGGGGAPLQSIPDSLLLQRPAAL
ncbi:MAG TPA: hypothetical protein VG841_07950 [Caulobacterales bacterium]|nr:hypothetical protein [Caulobacterales bacterium]